MYMSYQRGGGGGGGQQMMKPRIWFTSCFFLNFLTDLKASFVESAKVGCDQCFTVMIVRKYYTCDRDIIDSLINVFVFYFEQQYPQKTRATVACYKSNVVYQINKILKYTLPKVYNKHASIYQKYNVISLHSF